MTVEVSGQFGHVALNIGQSETEAYHQKWPVSDSSSCSRNLRPLSCMHPTRIDATATALHVPHRVQKCGKFRDFALARLWKTIPASGARATLAWYALKFWGVNCLPNPDPRGPEYRIWLYYYLAFNRVGSVALTPGDFASSGKN